MGEQIGGKKIEDASHADALAEARDMTQFHGEVIALHGPFNGLNEDGQLVMTTASHEAA